MRCLNCGCEWIAHVLQRIEACWCFTPETER